jgi:hypothetical protein
MHSAISKYEADKGFPSERFPQDPDPSTFTLAGICVGVVTGTYLSLVTKDPDLKGHDRVKLIRYDRDPKLRFEPFQPSTWPEEDREGEVTFENTSWGPCKTEIGDIVIVAASSRLPLVLRKYGKYYLFVGCCWLIDLAIEDFTSLSKWTDVRNLTKPSTDTGFSDIMHGNAVVEIGKNRQVEKFSLL